MKTISIILALVLATAAGAQPALDASVVLRTIENGQTTGVGSGTVIDTQPDGSTLIVTAGHVVSDVGIGGQVRIAFHDGQAADGKVISFRKNPDIGLVEVKAKPPGIATVAQYDPESREQATRIGMFGIYPTSVLAINKYSGPANISVGGAANQGDSGGGIFNGKGEIIGVCTLADQNGDESIGTGLREIHSAIKLVGVTQVGCHWERDQNGNCVRVCDNAPQQQPQQPPQQQLPPLRPPVNPQQPLAPAQPVNPPIKPTITLPGLPGPQGPAGAQGPKGETGAQGPAGKDGQNGNDAACKPATINFIGVDGKIIATATVTPGAVSNVTLPPINFRVLDQRGAGFSTEYQPARLGSYVTLPFGPAQ